MRRAVIVILWVVLTGLVLAEMARGAEFTTDERSLLHVGVGAGAGAAVDVMLYQTDAPLSRPGRIGLATLAVAVPAVFKEYVLDASPDAGDLFYGVASALAGAAAADYGQEWVGFITTKDDAVMVGAVWSWQ